MARAVSKRQTGRELGKRMKKYWPLLVMMLPGILFFLVFCYGPMYGILLAFKDYKISQGILGSPWVGLEYFDRIFHSRTFWEVMRNTMAISSLKLVFGFFPPILFALLLKEIKIPWLRKLTQTCSYLPYFISWIIMAGILKEILSQNGVMNQIVTMFGGEPHVWLSEPQYFWAILVISDIWKGFGWGSIIYFSALSGIDEQLYEAAALDGASRFQRALRITLPLLVPVITINLILSMSGILNAGFDQIFNLQNNAVDSVANIIDTYVYELGVQSRDYSMSTAIGLFKSVIALILMVTTNGIARKINGEDYTLW